MSGEWFVYWLKNSAGDVIYVGITTCLDRRWSEHQRRLGPEIQGTASAGPFTRKQALAIEAIEHLNLSPKYVGNMKCLPNRFSTRTADLPYFHSYPHLPEDDVENAAVLDRILSGGAA